MSDDSTARVQRVIDQQNEHLAIHGFGKAFSPGGLFGASLTYCLKCGAAIPLTPAVDGEDHPLDLHKDWHDSVEVRR